MIRLTNDLKTIFKTNSPTLPSTRYTWVHTTTDNLFILAMALDEFFTWDNFKIKLSGLSHSCHRYLLYTKKRARIHRLQKAFCIKGSITYGGEQVHGRDFEVNFLAKFCHLCLKNTTISAPERWQNSHFVWQVYTNDPNMSFSRRLLSCKSRAIRFFSFWKFHRHR